MGLFEHERSVRYYQRRPSWSRPTFKTEVIGEHDAFVEGEKERRERIENMPVTDVNHQTYLPLSGGPLDGGGFRVPTMMLRKGGTTPITFPIPIPAEPSKVIVPAGTHIPRPRAIYQLDLAAPPTLRFVRTESL